MSGYSDVPVLAVASCSPTHPALNGVGSITRNDRGQTDAALVRRFRQAVARRDRAAVFDGVVRRHRDAVLGLCAERLWPDADAAVAAARDVFVVAYLAMADPAKLARPDRLRDWLLGIAADGGLASGLPAGVDAIDWRALPARIAADVPDEPGMRGFAARQAWLRHWLERILATLPQPRQQMYDLFARRALDSRNAATELGTGVAEARRLRRENREAILRAFEVTALAAGVTDPDPLGGETPGCGHLRQILADAGVPGIPGVPNVPGVPSVPGVPGVPGIPGVQQGSVVLPADLRLAVTRHAGQCETCRDRRDDLTAQWAQELLPILAGAELNEQVIEDLPTIPEPARPFAWAPADGRHRDSRVARPDTAPLATAPLSGGGPSGGPSGGRAFLARRAAVAGAGLLVVLLVLGFAQPGFLRSTAASVPGASSSSSDNPGSSGSLGGSPQVTGTATAASRPGAARRSPAGLPRIAGVTSAAPSSLLAPPALPTVPAPGTHVPSSSTSSTSSRSAQPTTAPTRPPSPSAATPSPSPPVSATPPTTPAPSTVPPSSPAPSTSATSASPTPTPSTSAPSATPSSTPSSAPAPSTVPPSSPAPAGSPAG